MSNIEDGNKQALELFSLICYNELRRKVGGKLNHKFGQKLNELIFNGSTAVKVRGKNIRVKIPLCRALKKLTNFEDGKDDSALKVPETMSVVLRPRSQLAWSQVQVRSHNPRLILSVSPEQRLSHIIDFLCAKWRLNDSTTDRDDDPNATENPAELRLFLSSSCQLTPIVIQPAPVQAKMDLSFSAYLANGKGTGAVACGANTKRLTKVGACPKTDDYGGTGHSRVKHSRLNDDKDTSLASGGPVTGEPEIHRSGLNGAKSDSDTARKDASPDADDVHSVNNADGDSYPICVTSRLDRLRSPIDRTVGQLFTIAELYLMLARPQQISLEYDWVDPVSGHTATSGVRDRLRALVSVARAAFNAIRDKNTTASAGGATITSSPSVTSKSGPGTLVSPVSGRCTARTSRRGDRAAVGRSPSVRSRRESSDGQGVAEATLDQTANCGWPSLSLAVSSAAADVIIQNPTIGNVITVDVVPSVSPALLLANADTTVFRMPSNAPPKITTTIAPSTDTYPPSEPILRRAAVLAGLSKRPRRINKPNHSYVQQSRTILPKSPSRPFSALLSASSGHRASDVNTSATCTSSAATSKPPVLISMAPTEIHRKRRRIIPTPVPITVPSAFPPESGACSTVLSRDIASTASFVNGGTSTDLASSVVLTAAASTTRQLFANNAITGVDAFLQQSSDSQGLPCETTSSVVLSESAALISGADSLDLSLSMVPEAAAMGDKLLDLALANSNSSFPGGLESSSQLGIGAGVTPSVIDANSSKQRRDESPWLSAEDLSLGGLLGDSPAKLLPSTLGPTAAESTSVYRVSTAAVVTQTNSLIGAVVHFTESSRDSAVLANMESSLQCMLNENSLDLTSKFNDLIDTSSSGAAADLTGSGSICVDDSLSAVRLLMPSSTVVTADAVILHR